MTEPMCPVCRTRLEASGEPSDSGKRFRCSTCYTLLEAASDEAAEVTKVGIDELKG